jgi:GTPase Era involved in 16S rRNA processing
MSALADSPAELPVIAILGDVNHGKSSVVATLTEDDSVAIGPFPTTVHCQRFRVRDLIVFVDTPGFQNAREALRELQPAAHHPQPLTVFREFVERHRDDRYFVNECRLFDPVVGGAVLLYVVDTSQPMEPRHEAEMEILRLTGATRIALLNHTAEPVHREAWEARLRQHFSTVIEFDAHQADFANRIDVLDALAKIDVRHKAQLLEAIKALSHERDQRLDNTARIIVDLIDDALTRHVAARIRDASAAGVAELRKELEQKFRDEIVKREKAAHREIVKTFEHRLVSVGDVGGRDLLMDDLFVEDTWRLIGLNSMQLTAAAAGAGALVGAKIDLVTGGASWGLGALIGAGVGGGIAFAGSKKAPRIEVKLPFLQVPIAGAELVAGPVRHENFPWILLERAMGVFMSVSRRAHARRDHETLNAQALAMRLKKEGASVEDLPDGERKQWAKVFAKTRKGRVDVVERDEFVRSLREWLARISAGGRGRNA